MIISVTLNTRISTDNNISHRTEVIVDSEEEAKTAGKNFWEMVLAFNAGITEGVEEA